METASIIHTKDELEKMCRNLKIPVTPASVKHELVMLISRHNGEADPVPTAKLYSGKLATLPKTISAISNMSVAKLRKVLHYHGFSALGNKDQLALRVYLLRQGETAAINAREEEQIKDLIGIYKVLSFAQRKLQLRSTIYQQRTFSTRRL